MGKVFGALNHLKVDHWNPVEQDMPLLSVDRLTSVAGLAKEGAQSTVLRWLSDNKERADGRSALVDPSGLAAFHQGSDDKPDVELRVDLVGLHMGDADRRAKDKDQRATLRVDFGQSDQSPSKLTPLFWSIAAGLDLYGAIKKGEADAPAKLRGSFDKAFSGRPAVINGGLAEFRFEVVAHKEVSWWKEIFSFFQSPAGNTLTSFIGFPGIVDAAVNIINEAFDVLGDKAESVLSGPPMRLALSKYAHDAFTGGNDNIKMGFMNPGFYVILPGKMAATVNDAKPYFLGNYSVLLPDDMVPDQYTGPGDDPFRAITYAVVKVQSIPTKVGPSL